MTSWESLGGSPLDGPAAADLLARLTEVRGTVAAAREAFNQADRSTILQARETLDLAEADQRTFDRELRVLNDAARFPPLPNLEAFARAKADTEALAKLAAGKRPATAMHVALDQGRDASPEVARLWIAFERDEAAADLYARRWARYTEAR